MTIVINDDDDDDDNNNNNNDDSDDYGDRIQLIMSLVCAAQVLSLQRSLSCNYIATEPSQNTAVTAFVQGCNRVLHQSLQGTLQSQPL